MYQVLHDLRVVECASFIAAPACALHLQQMGAQVIRIDPIGGGPDFHRWPLAANGSSLYWEGLNKGKLSIAVDFSSPEGRELVAQLVCAPGEGAGLFVTNFPVAGFLSHERLSTGRSDLITARIMGWPDGTPAVDYAVNAAVGVPMMTGEPGSNTPVNHVLPAWDLLTGAYAAFALLAAERSRRDTGLGQEVRVALSDMGIASLGHLGQIAEVFAHGADRPRMGNTVFGAFGRDFATRDGQRLMVVAITRRQWAALVSALGLDTAISGIEQSLGVSFSSDEGLRFRHRDLLMPLVEAAIVRRTAGELATQFDAKGVCWGLYRSLQSALAAEPRLVAANPLFAAIHHPSGLTYPTPGSAATLMGCERAVAARAPVLGEHTDAVLAQLLGLSDAQIGRLHDCGRVAGPGTRIAP